MAVADALILKLEEVAGLVAAAAGVPAPVKVAYMGHNSDNYGMVVLETQLRRLEGAGGLGWCGRLRAAGVKMTIDTKLVLGKKYKDLAPLLHLGFHGGNGKLSEIYWKVTGLQLSSAHSADGDVKGLIAVINESKEMRECVLNKKVGRTLEAWEGRQAALGLREAYVKEMKEKARAADMPSPPADQGHAGGGLAA